KPELLERPLDHQVPRLALPTRKDVPETVERDHRASLPRGQPILPRLPSEPEREGFEFHAPTKGQSGTTHSRHGGVRRAGIAEPHWVLNANGRNRRPKAGWPAAAMGAEVATWVSLGAAETRTNPTPSGTISRVALLN